MQNPTLEGVWNAALGGERQVLLIECPDPSALAQWNSPREAEHQVQRFTVAVDARVPWPYAPFLPVLVQHYERWPAGAERRAQVEQDLALCGVYFRHRSLWGGWLTQEAGWPESEDLIAQEIPFERGRLEQTLVALVQRMVGSDLLCIVVLTAGELGVESQALLQRHEVWEGMRLLVLLEANPDTQESVQMGSLIHEWRAQGRVLSVPEFATGGTRSRLSTLPPFGGSAPALIQCLAFDAALAYLNLVPEGGDGLEAVECLIHLQQFEQALYRLLPLLAHGRAGERERSRAYRLSAQIHLGLHDHRLAQAAALQAWRHGPRVIGDLETLRLDFLFTLTPSLASPFPEISAEVAGRLPDQLLARGWTNHILYLETQNTEVMRLLEEGSPEAALERCRTGLKRARSLGNARREGVVYHSYAHVLQALGRVDEADRVYRRAVSLIRRHSRPHEVARVENGQGYYYMTIGKYREAWQCHARALALLERTRYHEETLNTLINLARIQLLAGWPEHARLALEKIVVAMEKLQMVELPYQRATTIQALLGLSAVRSGELLRARQIVRVIQNRLSDREPTVHGEVYVWWLQALVARALQDHPGERAAWGQCQDRIAKAPGELRYLDLQIALDQGILVRAGSLCLSEAAHPRERALILARSRGQADPRPERLPRLLWEPDLLLETAARNKDWRELQKSMRASHFLQAWQTLLTQEPHVDKLQVGCRELIQAHFLVDQVQLSPNDGERQGEDSLNRYGRRSRWVSASDLSGTPWLGASWLCLHTVDGVWQTGWVASIAGEPYFSPEDHLVIVLAFQQLSTFLVAMRQTALLAQSEKMSALGSLVAGIAHEINTPVGIAVTGISYLHQRFGDTRSAYLAGNLSQDDLGDFLDAGHETGDLVLRNLMRAGGLIDSFKRVASDQTSEERRSFGLREYLEEVLLSLSPKWRKSHVEVRVEGAGGQVVDSYPGAVAQVLTNLVINALTHAFTPDQGGQVVVRVEELEGPEREFVVSDNGSGVHPSHLSHLFEPFFTTKRNQGGTGLGLHVSYNLVHNVLGGTITVESQWRVGTTFRVRIPAVAPRFAPGVQ